MMQVLKNPPLTGKAGRPRTTHCKRGHERQPGKVSCVACRSLRQHIRYHSDPELRARKQAYQVQWRAAFIEKNGYSSSALYA